MKFVKNNYMPIILFIVAAIVIAPYLKDGGILASGESSVYLNPSFYNFYSTWEDRLNFGSFSPHQSNIYLFSILWSVFDLFSFIMHPSLLFIFLSVFLSSLFLYYCLDGILRLKNKLLYLPACLLYTYNVFRMLGPLNERLNLLFIFLPLFFLFYYKLLQTKKWKYVFWLVIVSIVSSSMGGNLPVFLIPYLLMLFYFTYYIFSAKNLKNIWKDILIKNIVLLLLILVGNLFWIIPLAVSLLELYAETEQGATLWSATGAGTFADHFRFLGSWAWRAGDGGVKYYPFAENFDKSFLLISTYLVAVLSWVYLFDIKNKLFRSIKIFILILAIGSFLLLAGNKGSLGFIHAFLYNSVPFFKMYREPFTKFTSLFIFASSIGLVFSLVYLRKIFKDRISYFVVFVSSIILINAYPLFTSETMPIEKWSNGKKDFLVNVPEYWKEAKDMIENSFLDSKLMLFPYNTYGMSYNWDQGAGIAGNMADYLLSNNIIRAWDIDESSQGLMLKSIFKDKRENINVEGFLGLLNSKYILQENDAEWRYSVDKIDPPSVSNAYIENNGFKKIAKFGKFSLKYIEGIVNENENESNKLKRELRDELKDQPALILYGSNSDKFTPHIYIPQKNIISDDDSSNLIDVISTNDFNEDSFVVFFEGQNVGKDDNLESLSIYKGANSNDDKELPTLEFKKINPTKYRVRVHGASGKFPMVFSESFHDGWRAYVAQVESEKLSSYKDNKIKNSDTKYQILDTKYKVLDGNQEDPKVINDGVNPKVANGDGASQALAKYKILDGNMDDQASKEELADFVQKGWVTDLGDQKEKTIEHKKWNGDKQKEELDYVEKYNIDFVSKNFQGTIQNDNLPSGKFYETWLAKSYKGSSYKVESYKDKFKNLFELNKDVVELPAEDHLMVNGYANAWIIDPSEVCQVESLPNGVISQSEINSSEANLLHGVNKVESNGVCVKNSDGTYDLELVVEFWPQRLFYVGLGISGTTLLGCLGYLGYDFRRRRKKEKIMIDQNLA